MQAVLDVGGVARFRHLAVIDDVQPGLGLLVQASRTGILPIYLTGTYKAMPKGTWLPKVAPLEARIGRFLPGDQLLDLTAHLGRRQQANRIVEVVRSSLCALRDGVPFDLRQELPPPLPGDQPKKKWKATKPAKPEKAEA